jgi:phosphoglycolate phosphatase-like HAD superfamily hydrolase
LIHTAKRKINFYITALICNKIIDDHRGLELAKVIFWDFDGVIKDSVDVKTEAYERLFLPYGVEFARGVRQHHEANGGMSRFDKIPLYLDWAGQPATFEQTEECCHQFSKAVVQAVIDSPWVPGVREYLLKHYVDKNFVVVTATPQNEIEEILGSLQLSHCFREVFGAPIRKVCAIQVVLERLKCSPDEAVMIGDSESDLLAAQANLVPFLLRRTSLNGRLQATYQGPMFEDLNDE